MTCSVEVIFRSDEQERERQYEEYARDVALFVDNYCDEVIVVLRNYRQYSNCRVYSLFGNHFSSLWQSVGIDCIDYHTISITIQHWNLQN